MHRALRLLSRRLFATWLAGVALLATASLAHAARNGPDPKEPSKGTSIPCTEPEVASAASAVLEPTETPATPAAGRSDHAPESALGLKLLASGPKGGTHLSAERTARPNERRGSLAVETRANRSVSRRGASRASGSADYVARPHRMPSPEIL